MYSTTHRVFRLVAVVVVLLCAAHCALAQNSVELRMAESGGIARSQWPVTVGIPFSKGVVTDLARIGLRNKDGAKAAVQAKALCKWPDGSVKWALLDYQADLEPAKSTVWSLITDNNETPSAGPVLAQKTSAGILAITGPLKILVAPASAAQKGLFSIWLDQNGDRTFTADESVDGPHAADVFIRLQSTPPGPPDRENWLRDAPDDKGTRFLGSLDKARTATIEENGPMRAVIRIDGQHISSGGRRAFPYTLRLHIFKGSGRIKFQHTFVASEDVKTNFLREAGVIVPFRGKGLKGTVGLENGQKAEPLNPGDALSISAIGDPRLYHLVSYRQKKQIHAKAEKRINGQWQTLAEGQNPPGWATLINDRGAAIIAFRDFRRLHPKELRIEGNGRAIVYLWPERGAKCLDLRRRSDKEDKGYVENGSDKFGGRGIAKTHEWTVSYSANQPKADQGLWLSRAINAPIFPYISPAYYAQTQAFGEFQPYDPKAFPRLEATLAFGFRYMRAVRNAFGMDGMIDWGDIAISGVGEKDHKGAKHPEGIPWRGYTGWCNSDFSLAHGFFLHYIRTGDRQVMLDGEAMAMHVMDIDTNHYSPEDPTQIGRGHRHDQQHWGNGLRDYCYAPNAAIDLYLLTGNRRAFDVAREMADHFVATGGAYGRYMTLRFWEISGEEKYLQHAKNELNKDLGKRGREGWPFAIGANFRSNSYDGVGYAFYDSIMPDPRLRKAFSQAMDFLRPRYTTSWRSKGHPVHLIFALAHKYAPTPENTEMLKIAVWLACKGVPKSPETFNLPADAPFEDMVRINQATIKLGRTDVFALYYLVGLPRVMARLKAVGISESEAIDYKWKWVEPPSFVEILDNTKVKPDSGKSWHYYTKHQSPSYRIDLRMPKEIQQKWRAALKNYTLFENDLELGPMPYSAAKMRKYGKTGWTRRLSGAIHFTTPDNSDPRTNKRTYKFAYISEKDRPKEERPSKFAPKQVDQANTGEIVPNGGFEIACPKTKKKPSGVEGWNNNFRVYSGDKKLARKLKAELAPTALRKISNTNPHSGKSCAMMSVPSDMSGKLKAAGINMAASWWDCYARLPAAEGDQKYKLTFYYRGKLLTDIQNSSMRVTVQFFDRRDKPWRGKSTRRAVVFAKWPQPKPDDWQKAEVELDAPKGTQALRLTLQILGYGEIYLDDVVIAKQAQDGIKE
jgi:PcRGLX-like protein central beta sandwich domain/PcRGLX-like protein C-terminal alpha/alpha toroid domain/PcRGLX-like N-terminal RIFT barrel domain